MRKKIPAYFLALCLVAGLLPIRALAAELSEAQRKALRDQGFSGAQIQKVKVIDKDAVLSADFDDLVVVAAPCIVTVQNAALKAGVAVVPGAAGARIVVAAGGSVKSVTALDQAEVVVERDAQAALVTLDAARCVLNVSGRAGDVRVNEAAEKSAIVVAADGSVSEIEMAAPASRLTVNGSLGTVDVAKTALNLELGGANAGASEVSGAFENVIEKRQAVLGADGRYALVDKADASEAGKNAAVILDGAFGETLKAESAGDVGGDGDEKRDPSLDTGEDGTEVKEDPDGGKGDPPPDAGEDGSEVKEDPGSGKGDPPPDAGGDGSEVEEDPGGGKGDPPPDAGEDGSGVKEDPSGGKEDPPTDTGEGGGSVFDPSGDLDDGGWNGAE